MKTEIIKLKEGNEKVTLRTYISEDEPELQAAPRPAMIVMPGGAYAFLADREGEPAVKKFFAEGFNCFLLKYSIAPDAEFPEPLREASLAVIHVKENAAKYNVDPDRVFVCGFSAGGHLAASIGTMWHLDMAKPYDDMPYGLNKPCGMILCYPWITLEEKYRHLDCTLNICKGGEITEDRINLYSAEKQVSDKTVPAYIWTTCTDTCVEPENTLMMASALSAHKIPYELHVFSRGPHGLSLANEQTSHRDPSLEFSDISTWIDEAVAWCKNNF